MNAEEVRNLLVFCTAVDGRRMEAESVPAWLVLLEDVDAEYAYGHAREHYRCSIRALLPADIVQGWRDSERDRHERATFDRALAAQGVSLASPESIRTVAAEVRQRLARQRSERRGGEVAG